MSRFREKGYHVKENAPIYLTPDMDRTARWFQEVLGWYSSIVERDGQGRGGDHPGGDPALGWKGMQPYHH